MRNFTLFVFLLLTIISFPTSLNAKDSGLDSLAFLDRGTSFLQSDSSEEIRKVKYKFGGIIFLYLDYNSYESYAPRDVVYCYPLAPSYNSAGEDVNNVGKTYFSPYASRLNFSVSDFTVLGGTGRAFVEVDFLGASDDYLQHIRMRHAYLELSWEKDKILVGQTNNLMNNYDNIILNTLEVGAGLPYLPFNRNVQIRYERKLTSKLLARATVAMYASHKSVGPTSAQAYAKIPEMSSQIVYGDVNDVFFATLTFDSKFLRPRNFDSKGNKISTTVSSFAGTALMKFNVSDYNLVLASAYGGNMTPYLMPGGYGKVAGESVTGDYSYSNVLISSSWADFESPKFGMWQFGVFAGHTMNLGSKKELDLSKDSSGDYLYGYYTSENISWYSRVAPRVWFSPYKGLSFGLEYSRNIAQWGESTDNYLKAKDLLPITTSNRMLFCTRFIF